MKVFYFKEGGQYPYQADGVVFYDSKKAIEISDDVHALFFYFRVRHNYLQLSLFETTEQYNKEFLFPKYFKQISGKSLMRKSVATKKIKELMKLIIQENNL